MLAINFIEAPLSASNFRAWYRPKPLPASPFFTAQTPEYLSSKIFSSSPCFTSKLIISKTSTKLSNKINFDIYFGVTNLMGIKYPMMIFANQMPDVYTAAPENPLYFGGLNLKYNF
jgi:hypothetical protein